MKYPRNLPSGLDGFWLQAATRAIPVKKAS
jgi:hypothetical protein